MTGWKPSSYSLQIEGLNHKKLLRQEIFPPRLKRIRGKLLAWGRLRCPTEGMQRMLMRIRKKSAKIWYKKFKYPGTYIIDNKLYFSTWFNKIGFRNVKMAEVVKCSITCIFNEVQSPWSNLSEALRQERCWQNLRNLLVFWLTIQFVRAKHFKSIWWKMSSGMSKWSKSIKAPS